VITSDGKLLWIHLKTTKTQADGWYDLTYEVELLQNLNTQTSEDHGSAGHNQDERWSPMFLVSDAACLQPFNSKVTGVFWLLYDDRPIQLAALLQNCIPADLAHGLFLTHGMASVVLLLESPDSRVDPQSLFSGREHLFAIEQWTIKAGRICNKVILKDTMTSSISLPESAAIPDCPEHMPYTVFRHMQDNDLILRRIMRLCGRYRPSFLRGIRDLLGRSLRMLDDIHTTSDQAGNGDPIAWRILQAKAYSLVHLNSMFAYCLSQGLSGNPSVLKQKGLLPSHSVFGVGTAYKAVWATTHFIEEGFISFDIQSEMQERYFGKQSADYHSELFKPELNDMQPRAINTERKAPGHVNLFSGRLGFHSSAWAVAAPVDALHEAAAPTWNLMTLSHELLHIHVDGLLEFVLSPNPIHERGLTQDELDLKMARLGKENANRKDLSIIDRIRQKVARYILQSAGCLGQNIAPLSQLPRAKSIVLPEVTVPSQFRDMLLAFWRRLTEYVVHILDFFYFYWGDVDNYLRLVLTSWNAIPSVYDDVGHYIMRCLLTVSTREMDPNTATGLMKPLNFDESLEAFMTGIKNLAGSDGCEHFVSEIRAFIRNTDNKEFLRLEFNRAKSLMWMAVMYFYCRPLRMYFEIGKNIQGGILDETALCPEFEFGTVQERLPISPIAFLSKYFSLDYVQPDEPHEDVPVEAASLWLFSWLASCGP
jgi:hypothetical protein